jgi:2-polyprenyl-3-methyl-5-hydroxy-6-metoxy-1,4-benzoquinol methylase
MSVVLQIRAEEDWKRLGEIDPYYGVLSDDKFKSANIDDEAKQEFFASGAFHVDTVLAVLTNSYGFSAHGKALDFGCGVGRITNALAPHFEKVIGLDIAPGMLAEAERVSAKYGFNNIEYDSPLNSDRMRPEIYDFVHTFIVLQHIPIATGLNIIRTLIRSIKIGGVGAIHFTIADSRLRAGILMKNVLKTTPVLRNIGNLLTGRPWNYPAMQMNRYSVRRVIQIFSECHVENFTVFRVDDWGTIGLFVFFRKAPPESSVSPWSNPVKC